MEATNKMTSRSKSQTVGALRELLSTGDEADRCYVSRALGALGDPTAIPDLIKRLRDKDIDVCVDAADALGKMGATSAISDLIETINKDPEGDVRISAVDALGRIGTEQAIDTLIKIAASRPDNMSYTTDDWDPWWDMQLKAVMALGQMRVEKAATVIEKLLDDDEGQDIESELLKSLAFMANTGESILIKRLKKALPRERRRIIHALGLGKTPKTLRILKLAITDQDADVRTTALESLALCGSAEQLPDMIKLFHDEDPGVRKAATKAVSSLSSSSGNTAIPMDELVALLTDSDPAVRAAVLNILSSSSAQLDENTQEIVREAMTDIDAGVATAACRLTGKCCDPLAKENLLAFVNDTTLPSNIRTAATLALGGLGLWNEDIATSLTQACVDKHQPVRLAALNALLELDPVSKNVNRGTSDDNETEMNLPTSLDSILFVFKGEITPTSDTESKQSVSEKNGESHNADSENTTAPEVTANSEDNRTQDNSSITEAELSAEVSTDKAITSTMDAITKTNVEVALALKSHKETTQDNHANLPEDESLKPYLDLVRKNDEIGRWLKTRDTDASILDDARRLATRILGKSTHPQIISVLIEALEDEDEVIRRDATNSLSEIHARNPQMKHLSEAIKALTRLLSSEDREERVASLRTLGAMADETVVPDVTALLDDEDSAVCIQAIVSLSDIVNNSATASSNGDSNLLCKTVERFSQLLDNTDPGIRTAAATNLTPLIKLLRNSGNQSLVENTVRKIAGAGFENNGDQARILGRVLKNTAPDIATSALLSKLAELDTSRERRFAIEMLEETFRTGESSASSF